MQILQVLQDFIAVGRRNRPGRNNPCDLITIHETGNRNAGADALAHARYLHSDTAAGLPVSWHYSIDDKRIVQHLPDNEDAFHAGDGSGPGNRASIGIEICVNKDGNLDKAVANTIPLVAELCRRHNIAAERVVQHWHWNRKECPFYIRAGLPIGWAEFIRRVGAQLGTHNRGSIVRISNGRSQAPAPRLVAAFDGVSMRNTERIDGRWITRLPDGQTVGVRDVLEAWGLGVSWDEATATVTAGA